MLSVSCCALALLVSAAGATPATGVPDGEKIPVTTSSAPAMDYFLKGRTYVDNLRLTDGIAYFTKAAEADPKFALAYLYLAQTASTPQLFFSNLEKAVGLAAGASAGEQLWIRGFRAGAYGDPVGQEKAYAELAELFPGDERALMLLGVYHFGQQEYAEAAAWLKKSITVNPKFAPAYNQLGYAYRFLARYDDAEATFKTYTEVLPDDPNPYDSYAELLLKIGKFKEAIHQYRKALAIDPNFGNSYAGIAAALAYQGKHDEARAELMNALRRSRTDAEKRGALFSMTVVAVDRGDFEEALKDVEKQFALGKAIDDKPAMSGDMILKGNILLEQGKTGEALEAFTSGRDLIAASGVAAQVKENAALLFHYNAARVALAAKDFATAERETGELRKGAEAKKNANQIRLAHECAGAIALSKKEYAKAIEELKGASQQNPYNLLRLGLACQGANDQEGARKHVQAAARFYGLPLLNYAFVRRHAEKMLSTL
jgi:tetratricopeptide (TPR) repeat protein